MAGDGAEPAGLAGDSRVLGCRLLARPPAASTSASLCCAQEGRDCCRKTSSGLGPFPLPSSTTVSAVQAVGD